MKKLAVCIFLCLVTSGFKWEASDKTYAQFRPYMQSIYHSLEQILGFALVDSAYVGKEHAPKIEEKLKSIAEQATAIHALAKQSDKGHEVIAAELERSANQAYAKYKAGFREQSRVFISDVLHACFGCHTSRGSQQDSAYALDFSKAVKIDEFEPLAKARFLALSRQFEASAAAYEGLLLADKLSVDELINADPMVEYMIIALRVLGEAPRVEKTLATMLSKAYPAAVKADIQLWLDALRKSISEGKTADPLESAKAMIASARASKELPRDRGGLVQYIQASRLLHDYLKNDKLAAVKKAEAYYELGACEMAIGMPLFVEESVAYFEEAVRLAPKSELARKAYARYEENLLLSYSGRGGNKLPDEEKKKLDSLKKLAF